MSWQQTLQEYVTFLKEKYGLTDSQIQEELFGEKIPAEAFATDLTPLQTVAKHLNEHYGRTEREIARLLGRTTTEVEKFLAAGRDAPPLPTTGAYLLPVRIFADRTLSASEHIVSALEERGLTVAEIADLIGKSEQTVWTLHYRAQRKRGDAR